MKYYKMNINKHHYLSILILISLILLSFPQTLLSQGERLAVVNKFKGEVKVEHDTVWKTVSKIGNRIRNSSVYNEDTVLTMPVSTADLVFNDNTRLEVNEDTTLTISIRQMTEEERTQEGFIRKVAGTQKEVCRNINLKIGRIWANITPSKSVLTEFETPTGVASVRGTEFGSAVEREEIAGRHEPVIVTSFEVTEGQLGFENDQMQCEIMAGVTMSAFKFEEGTSLEVDSGQLSNVKVKTKTGMDAGMYANIKAGQSVVMQGTDKGATFEGSCTVDTVAGTATVKDGTVSANVDCTDTCSVTFGAEKGSVEVDTVGGTASLAEGVVLTAATDVATGEVKFSADKGKFTVDTEGGIATVEEGGVLATKVDCTDTCSVTFGAEKGSVKVDTVAGTTMTIPENMNASVEDTTAIEGGGFKLSVSESAEGAAEGAAVKLETGTGSTISMGVDSSLVSEVIGSNLNITGFSGDGFMTDVDGTKGDIDVGTSLEILPGPGDPGTPAPETVPETGSSEAGGTSDEDISGAIGGGAAPGATDEYGMPEGSEPLAVDTVFMEGFEFEVVTYEDEWGEYEVWSEAFDYSELSDTEYDQLESVLLGLFGPFDVSVQTPSTWETTKTWTDRQNAYTIDSFGPIVEPSSPNTNTGSFEEDFGAGAGFAVIHTGWGLFQDEGLLEKEWNNIAIPENRFSFDYNFITLEDPNISGNIFNDEFIAELHLSDSTTVELAKETVNSSTFTPVSGLPTDILNSDSGGQTGWKSVDTTESVPSGITQLHFHVHDVVDNWMDSAVLIDSVVFFQEEDPTWEPTETWTSRQNAYTTDSFGPIVETTTSTIQGQGGRFQIIGIGINTESFEEDFGAGARFAVIHTGWGDDQSEGLLEKGWNFTTSENRQISFDYNFITLEDPNISGNIFNDEFIAELHLSDSTTVELAKETVNSSTFTPVSGLPTDILNSDSGGQTGWKSVDTTESVPSGITQLHFHVHDVVDNWMDSAVLIDSVVFFQEEDPTWEPTETWTSRQNAYTTDSFGPIVETTTSTIQGQGGRFQIIGIGINTESFEEDFGAGARFAVIHTGFGNEQSSGLLEKEWLFTTAEDRQFGFDYNFISTEYDPFSDPSGINAFNDEFIAELHLSNGTTVELAKETVDVLYATGGFTSVTGLPTLDSVSGGETGWKSVDETVSVPIGITQLHFHVRDIDDSTFDSAVLIDNVFDPPVASTDYLLTFAKMIRGDMDTHNKEYPGDATSQSEHQAVIDEVDEVISDINTSIIKPSTTDIFDKLKTARDSLMVHDDTKGYAQHVGVAHHLLDSKILTDGGVAVNLTSINESMGQVKTFLDAHIGDFGDTAAHNDIRSQMDSILTNINTVKNNYDNATASAISSQVKEAFCDVIDHMVHSDAGHSHEGHHEANPFDFCHHDEGGWLYCLYDILILLILVIIE